MRVHIFKRARARASLYGAPVAAALVTSFLTQTANAQTAQATVTQAGATQAETEPSWISEIVVTGARESYVAPDADSATRTDTPLIEIPQSVEVINRTLIQEQDLRTLDAALVNVSGVTSLPDEDAIFLAPLVRGFVSEVYVDGLPIFGGNQEAFNPTSLIGADRIEVVKGPTSTVYGGGLGSPLGGLINIVSVRPSTDSFGGYAALRAGSFSTVDPYGDVNIPLTDTIAARIVGEYQHDASWVDRLGGYHWSVQPSLLIKLAPDTELLLRGQINQRRQLDYTGLPATQALAGQIDRNVFPGAPEGQPHTPIDTALETIELRHSFSDDLRLTVTGRYYTGDIDDYGSFADPSLVSPNAATPTVYPIFTVYMPTKAEEATFDANLLAKLDLLGGSHEFLGGVDYDHTNFASYMFSTFAPVGTLDLVNPNYASVPFGSASFSGPDVIGLDEIDHYQTIAAYIQDQANYDRLHLTASLRYTQLKFFEIENGVPQNNQTYHRITPRIGATVDVTSGLALYSGYETGFRGSFGFFGLEPPKPETSRNIEAGVKLALKDIGLSGTIAAFRQTRDNVATSDLNNPGLQVQTGQQRARGVETDFIWEPIPAFSLLMNYAYTQAEVTEDNAIPVGNPLAFVPKHSGRVAARYRLLDGPAKGVSFGAGVTAFSSRQLTLPNTSSVPGYATVDAQAAYEFGRYTIEVSAVNFAGSRAFDPYLYFSPVVMPTQPRSAYVTLKARF